MRRQNLLFEPNTSRSHLCITLFGWDSGSSAGPQTRREWDTRAGSISRAILTDTR